MRASCNRLVRTYCAALSASRHLFIWHITVTLAFFSPLNPSNAPLRKSLIRVQSSQSFKDSAHECTEAVSCTNLLVQSFIIASAMPDWLRPASLRRNCHQIADSFCTFSGNTLIAGGGSEARGYRQIEARQLVDGAKILSIVSPTIGAHESSVFWRKGALAPSRYRSRLYGIST